MYILTDSNGVIACIGEVCIESQEEAGVYIIDGAGFGLIDQKIYELEKIPQHIVSDKYKYLDGEFSINEDYREPFDPERDIEELRIAMLELTMLISDTQGGNM